MIHNSSSIILWKRRIKPLVAEDLNYSWIFLLKTEAFSLNETVSPNNRKNIDLIIIFKSFIYIVNYIVILIELLLNNNYCLLVIAATDEDNAIIESWLGIRSR